MELFPSAPQSAPINANADLDRFVRLSDVETAIGLKRSQIYRMAGDGTFPRPIKLGKASRWSLRAVKAWMDQQVTEAA